MGGLLGFMTDVSNTRRRKKKTLVSKRGQRRLRFYKISKKLFKYT